MVGQSLGMFIAWGEAPIIKEEVIRVNIRFGKSEGAFWLERRRNSQSWVAAGAANKSKSVKCITEV